MAGTYALHLLSGFDIVWVLVRVVLAGKTTVVAGNFGRRGSGGDLKSLVEVELWSGRHLAKGGMFVAK